MECYTVLFQSQYFIVSFLHDTHNRHWSLITVRYLVVLWVQVWSRFRFILKRLMSANLGGTCIFIHWAERYLILKSHQDLKVWDLMVIFSYCLIIWQIAQQHCCWDMIYMRNSKAICDFQYLITVLDQTWWFKSFQCLVVKGSLTILPLNSCYVYTGPWVCYKVWKDALT